ncbi:GNAT family N-acetyltransferase [Streptomyces sp. 4N509B]|uniref:GNAT family N-acetyltransferase n=1 Tax=Streptomyces sp. 4N509B TaxID=3457413 RepID=UPI003FCEED7D
MDSETAVTLRRLDEGLLGRLLAAAVADADPLEVMPPVPGPDPGAWTGERRAAFLRFHRSRSLAARPVETTFAVLVGEGDGGQTVVGAARLCPLSEGGSGSEAEAGLWLGRSHRGRGVGRAVVALLLERARDAGFRRLLWRTTPDNVASVRLAAALGGEPTSVDANADGDTDGDADTVEETVEAWLAVPLTRPDGPQHSSRRS